VGMSEAALVNLLFANMFGYVNNLRTGTHERGAFTLQFSHYAPAPSSETTNPSRRR
jgi:translation elongation factor EF-G